MISRRLCTLLRNSRAWFACYLFFMIIMVVPGGIARGFTEWDESVDMVAFDPPVDAPKVLSPSQVITRFHDTLIKSMKAGKEEGYAVRYAILETVVRESYDFKTISRMVLGSFWKEINEVQRESFMDAFSAFTIATYASRFTEFNGEKFQTISEKVRRKNLRLVHTVFTDGDGRERSFDYQLLLAKKQWRIVNIAVDGISDISLKRAEYTDIIKRKGFSALLKNLKDHTNEMEHADKKNKNG